jgi:hypothetical protein
MIQPPATAPGTLWSVTGPNKQSMKRAISGTRSISRDDTALPADSESLLCRYHLFLIYLDFNVQTTAITIIVTTIIINAL